MYMGYAMHSLLGIVDGFYDSINLTGENSLHYSSLLLLTTVQ